MAGINFHDRIFFNRRTRCKRLKCLIHLIHLIRHIPNNRIMPAQKGIINGLKYWGINIYKLFSLRILRIFITMDLKFTPLGHTNVHFPQSMQDFSDSDKFW
jgi:hypothetical protein